MLLLICIIEIKRSTLSCKMPDFTGERYSQINSESASKLFDSLVLLSESDNETGYLCVAPVKTIDKNRNSTYSSSSFRS